MNSIRLYASALVLSCIACAAVQAQTARPGGPQFGSDGGWTSNVTTGTWSGLAHAPPAGVSQTLLLMDGTVMAQRPNTNTWYKLTPDINGSYVNGTWTTLPVMPAGHSPLYFASAVLANNKVVVIGGEYNGTSTGVWTNKSSVYDPNAGASGTWTAITPPAGFSQIGDTQCSVMPNGDFYLTNISLSMSKLNPTTLTFSPLTSTGKTSGDNFDEEGWSLLADGTILTVNAWLSSGATTGIAQRYLPSTGQWISAGTTPAVLPDFNSKELGPQVLLPNGKVLAIGATANNALWTQGVNFTDPGSWVAAPSFGGGYDEADGPACLLPNGNVLCCASPGVFNNGLRFYEYDGPTMTQVNNIPAAASDSSFQCVMLMLPTGQVMNTDQGTSVQIYTPVGAPNPAWAPVTTSVPGTMVRGGTYTIQGMQFNGLSQCTAYGDDATNFTNYPIVRIKNNSTNHVFYCRSVNPSSMGVATGSLVVSTSIVLPAGMETGASQLTVVANGIPSSPVAVNVTTPQISGHVTLGEYSGAVAGTPITVKTYTAGTSTLLDTVNSTLDASGNFSVATTRVGTFDVDVKCFHWLSMLQSSVVFTSLGTSGLNYTLTNGDADQDNTVGPLDLNVLRTNFGGSNTSADLDGDGVVGPLDLNIIRNHFGQSGT